MNIDSVFGNIAIDRHLNAGSFHLGPVWLLTSLGRLLVRTNAFIKDRPINMNRIKQPPKAKIIPHELVKHGQVRNDPYYWLNDHENPAVIDYLNQENAYTADVMAPLVDFEKSLFTELKGRIKEDDATAPFLMNGYYYYVRYEVGGEYPIHCRKKGSLAAAEEIMLHGNQMAKGHTYFSIGGLSISPDNRLLAYAIDTRGRRIHQIRMRDLNTGKDLADELSDVTANMVWAADNQTLFYTKQDPTTLRACRIYRHRLGTPMADDVLVYEEHDETFTCYVGKTKSRQYLIIGCTQSVSSEYHILEADRPTDPFRLFHARERHHEYSIDHAGDTFYVLTNTDGATNFQLMTVAGDDTTRTSWQTLIPHREDVYLENAEFFRRFLVLEERSHGLTHLRILSPDGGAGHYLDFGEAAYTAYLGNNREYDTDIVRFGYTSMTTPSSVFDYHMETRQKTLIRQQPVLGDFQADNYHTERLHVPARDGAKIPVSLVYRKGFEKNGTAPCLLYGYGSYGATIDPSFNPARLSLLDRGFCVAIAHIRGGQMLGRPWYENGRLLHKLNTFHDFIDCGEYLRQSGYAADDKLFAMGGSAGGLLMGAVINMRPDLFQGVVADVPFVDVVTTMLDESIPLTTGEYDEWGNPNDPTYYKYMLAYSPYDQVKAQDYPHMLVTAGLHDSQVQYWEPAKWVAKMRAMKTDQNRLLLKTNMDAGHSGASGRFEAYRELATAYAFLLDLAGAAP